MARALYEGIAAEIAKSIDALPVFCRTAKRVYAAGGLTKSGVYNQILSDALGREIVVYSDPQATSIGAFVSAAVTLGLYEEHQLALDAARSHGSAATFEPDLGLADFYENYKRKTEQLFRAGTEIFS
jgi:xylulokinase/glycerol kinase